MVVVVPGLVDRLAKMLEGTGVLEEGTGVVCFSFGDL